MTVRRLLCFLTATSLLAWGCGSKEHAEPAAPPFVEAVPETTVFTDAEAVYYGDDGNTGISDMWNIILTTDMEHDALGNPLGPGKMLQISCNTSREQEMSSDCLEGVYVAPSADYDYSIGTFNPGSMVSVDIPGGSLEAPAMSYFGDLSSGSQDFVPDLLREGHTVVDINDDGTFTIEGTLIGQMFLKRNFTYTGELRAIDMSPSVKGMKKTFRMKF